MVKFMHLVFIRHGESFANRFKLVTGNRDTPLTESGQEQAMGLRKYIQDILEESENREVALYASPAKRAIDTAVIAGVPKESLIIDSRIEETDAGDVKDTPRIDFEKRYPDFFKKFDIYREYPNGESHYAMIERTREFLSVILSRTVTHSLIFSHNGPINSALHFCDGVNFTEFPAFLVNHCQVIERDFYITDF